MMGWRFEWLILSVLFCILPSKAEDSSGSNPQSSQLLQGLLAHCTEDIALYCPGNITSSYPALSKCLQRFDNYESKKCANFMRASAVGACNDDAQKLCPGVTTVHKLDMCITSQEIMLSQQCKWNVEMQSNAHTRQKEEENKSERFRKAVTGLCFFYVLIPLIAAAWAAYQSYTLFMNQQKFVFDSRNVVRGTKPPIRAKTTEWCVEFHDLTYRTRTAQLWWTDSTKEKARVLRRVSGAFKDGHVSAVVGPQGCGKSSLLRLLAGRELHGEMSGIRAATGVSLAPREYNKVMRQQGYVPACSQHDPNEEELLIGGAMSVWQTLLHAALLRLPERLGTQNIMKRALEVLQLVELHSARDVSTAVESKSLSVVYRTFSREPALSMYERQCLRLALQLLNAPQVIFLDEPTAHLNRQEAALFMKLLQKVSKVTGVAVVLTMEHPRPEEYPFLDTLLVLSPAGDMLYSGPAFTAATSFFTTLQCAPDVRSLRTTEGRTYATPVDYLYELIGVRPRLRRGEEQNNLRGDEDAELQGLLSADGHGGDIEMQEMTDSTHNHNASAERDVYPLTPGGESLHRHQTDETSNQGGTLTSRQSRAVQIIHDMFIDSSEYMKLHDRREILLRRQKATGNTFASRPNRIDANEDEEKLQGENQTEAEPAWNRLPEIKLQYLKRGPGVPPLTQVWVLFSRHIQAKVRNFRSSVWLIVQMLCVTSLLCVIFSHSTHSVLEKPQQAAKLLSWVSLYVLALQSVLVLSQHPFEGLAAEVSEWAHQLSALLRDVLSATTMCFPVLLLVYWWHPLNPDFSHVAFVLVCFVTGVCAWQALVRLCTVLLRPRMVVCWAVVVLMLVVGTWSGSGLFLSLQELPSVFSYAPYVSLSAMLQRALVVNDLHCCYLSTTCAELAQENELNCPKSLYFTGDGTDEGNLGRYYLQTVGMGDERPHMLLFLLFWVNAILRVVTIFILGRRNRSTLKVIYS